MASRFASNLTLLVLAALGVTTSLTFSPTVVGWLSLGFGCAAVSARTFTGGTLRWQSFAEAAALFGRPTTLGLIAYEVDVMQAMSLRGAVLRDPQRGVKPPMPLRERCRLGAL